MKENPHDTDRTEQTEAGETDLATRIRKIVDAKDEDGRTKLMDACEQGLETRVRQLIDVGADVNATGQVLRRIELEMADWPKPDAEEIRKNWRCARFYDWAHIGINLSLNSLQVDSRSLRYSSLIDEMPRT